MACNDRTMMVGAIMQVPMHVIVDMLKSAALMRGLQTLAATCLKPMPLPIPGVGEAFRIRRAQPTFNCAGASEIPAVLLPGRKTKRRWPRLLFGGFGPQVKDVSHKGYQGLRGAFAWSCVARRWQRSCAETQVSAVHHDRRLRSARPHLRSFCYW